MLAWCCIFATFLSHRTLAEMLNKIMGKMNSTKLDQFEIENIEDVLPMFEETFKIKLETEETEKINNFSEFSDLIISKIKFENDSLCTSQRAFYKFRKALENENIINKNKISPNTELKSIFSKKNRRKKVKSVEQILGYELDVLAPSQLTINILFFTLVLSFIGLFFVWKIALIGISISLFGYYLTKYTNRLDKQTVRELIERNTAQHYFKIRNNENSFNRNEFKAVILEWFSENAGIEKGFRIAGSRAAISSKHTLAIVNTGGATATEILQLAEYVQVRVSNKFGINLVPEPNLIGFI